LYLRCIELNHCKSPYISEHGAMTVVYMGIISVVVKSMVGPWTSDLGELL
jgi:hypothetical protein